MLWQQIRPKGVELVRRDVHTGRIEQTISLPSDAVEFAVGFEETAGLYDISRMRLIARLPAPCQDMRALTFAHDDQTLAVGGRCGSIRLFSVGRGEVIRDKVRDLWADRWRYNEYRKIVLANAALNKRAGFFHLVDDIT